MRFFALDGEQMGNLAASYFYAYFIMQIPMGILLDRFGPRRVMTISIFLCALGALILSQSHLLLFAGAGRFITGIGAAVASDVLPAKDRDIPTSPSAGNVSFRRFRFEPCLVCGIVKSPCLLANVRRPPPLRTPSHIRLAT